MKNAIQVQECIDEAKRKVKSYAEPPLSPASGSGALVPRTLTGRCRSGGDWGGSIVHAVADGKWKALCGKAPGRTSAGWSEWPSPKVTCPRCLKLMHQNDQTEARP
jgi:hypothetical protein